MKQTSGPSVHQEVVREQPTFNKWLVAVCGVFSFGLSYGLPVSMTAMFIDWQDTFEESRANIAVINGVTIGLLMGAAIVPGYLMSRFGPRLTMMLGVVIASLGLFLQLFSYSVDYMVATIGVMGGLGFSMTNLPVIPRMTSTFTKYQSIVIAALTIGTALANASLPYLYRYLIHVYSWRGACVVISGITLNLLVFGMVLTSTVTSRGQPPLVFRAEDEETLEQLTHLEVLDGHQEESSPFQSIVTQVICNDTDTHEKEVILLSSSVNSVTITDRLPLSRISIGSSKLSLAYDVSSLSEKEPASKDKNGELGLGGGGRRQALPPPLHSCPGSGESPCEKEGGGRCGGGGGGGCCRRLKASRFVFLSDPVYVMIVVTTCCVNSGLFSILALVMDLARNKGYEDESVAITLIMLTFVSSVAGRMFVGGVNLIPRMHSVLLLTGCGVMASVALITVAMATEFYTLVIGLVMVGSAMGGCTTIYAKCILDTSTVTLESYPLALGIANTSEGVFDALVPVLVATAVDTHGTYLYAFSILSGLCVSTAVVLSLTFVCVVLRKTG